MSLKVCTKCSLEKDISQFHKDVRYSDGRTRAACKACRSLERKSRYSKNKSHERSLAKKYWSENKERMQAWLREHYQNNKIRYKEYSKRFLSNNPGMGAFISSVRRSRKNQATPSWANLGAIKDIYKQREQISLETNIIHHVDHIIPLKGELVCGLHVEYNLRIIPAVENLSKSNKLIEGLM